MWLALSRCGVVGVVNDGTQGVDAAGCDPLVCGGPVRAGWVWAAVGAFVLG